MTTIAYRDGVLASDSLCTVGGSVCGQYDKIADIHGFLLGGCGAIANVCKFFDWFRNKHANYDQPAPIPPDDTLRPKENEWYTIIMVHKETGTIWQVDDGGYPHRLEADFMAIGSGRQFAIGAMEMGASAAQSITAAMRHDISTPEDILKPF